MNNRDGITADIKIGSRIDIEFTQSLVGDVTGYEPAPANVGTYDNPKGNASASSVYGSSYIAGYAFNGSTSNFWQSASGASCWLKIDLLSPTWTMGFGWYMYYYYAKIFDVYGSNDDSVWDKIYSGTMSAAVNKYYNVGTWSPVKYRYYKWDFTSLNSSYMAIYYLKLLSVCGNEASFTVTGKEYQYVGGPLIDKTYNIIECDYRYASVLVNVDISSGTLNNTQVSKFGDIVLGRA